MRICNDIIKVFAAVFIATGTFSVSAQGWMDVPEEPESEATSAEGENEEAPEGFVWVNPVEYFKLQKAKTSDGTGNDNFNNALKKQKKKIFGIKVHPIAGAVEPDSQIDDKYTYGNISGFIGVAVSGGTLTIDTGSAASGEYNIKYTMTQPIIDPDTGKKVATWDYDCSMNLAFSGIRMTSSDSGVNFSYTAKISGTIKGHGYGDRVKYNPDFPSSSASVSGNSSLAHFIYRGGESSLFLILSMPNISKGAEAHGPGPRVYFVVDKVLVAEEAPPPMTAEDKEILIDYNNDLMDWLTGYNDRLGLGEHTPEKESLVIQTIAAILSLLLGTGGVGLVGGSAGAVTGGFTQMIVNGGQPPTPPDIPPVERDPMRRPEDEDNTGIDFTGWTPPKPRDPYNLFHPTDYPDLCQKYIKEDSEGTVTLTDPATGQRTEFYPTEDGRWVRYYGDDNPLTSADLEERVRFSAENSDYVRQNAETAARNQREQHEAWEAQNKRDLERGYSDEMKEYRDWKAEQERIQKKEEYVEKLADKYHTTVDNLKDKIRQVQAAAEEESYYQQEIANHWDKAVKVATVVDNTCEFAVNVMGECIPGGRLVKNIYTFAKAPLVAASEAYAEGKGLAEGTAHVVAGLGKGALGVIQNQAGDLTKNPLGEYAITVGTEMVKDGMTVYEKTGDISKTMYGMVNSGAKKTGDFLLGKLVSGGMNKLRTGAEQSLQKGIININDDAGIRMKPETAKKILNFFNPKGGLNSTGAKGWNVEIKGANSSTFNADMNNWKLGDLSKNFTVKGTSNVMSGGQVNLPGMFATKTTEAASKFGFHDWEGHTAEGLTRDAVNLKTDLSNFKQALVNRAKEYGKNHPR